jgi:adenylosuccinate synthase
MDKTGRNSIRVGDVLRADFDQVYAKLKKKHLEMLSHYGAQEDLAQWELEFFEAIDFLKSLNIVNGEYFINKHLQEGKKVLAEGAQGSMLDVDFGTFPFVTSSNTISAGVCTGLGISPLKIREVIGITKAYCTRVGSGPFPTELFDAEGEELRKIGNEFGATTGRPRRCGWMDLVALQYACMINGVTQIVMTKSDVLDHFKDLKICTSYQLGEKITSEVPYDLNQSQLSPVYQLFKGWSSPVASAKTKEQLPEEIMQYLSFIESFLGVKVSHLSNGPGRDEILKLS